MCDKSIDALFASINTNTPLKMLDVSRDDKRGYVIETNKVLMRLSSENMTAIIADYGLLPVLFTINGGVLFELDADDLTGYIRYLDAYIIQETGGVTSNIQTLGEQVAGFYQARTTARKMRTVLISKLMAIINNLPSNASLALATYNQNLVLSNVFF